MIGIWHDPHPKYIKDASNGIAQVILALNKYLPEFGYEIVSDPKAAHLFCHHAGSQDGHPIHVTHCHGLIPTAMHSDFSQTAYGINAYVMANIMRSKATTVPSEWVADIIRRDFRFNPHVVPWGVEIDDWQPGKNGMYVLWAKSRADLVCSADYVNELARRAQSIYFVSTFGEKQNNVNVVGHQPFHAMKDLLKDAGVYLATTRETFGIQTLEAMACGVPILGIDWAGTANIVQHGVTGYLARPGDMNDLEAGLYECIKHRKEWGANAREDAKRYTWRETARQMASVYEEAARPHSGPEVSIVIPCYNYANWVGEAIDSALAQGENTEIIVVNDGSTDNSAEVIDGYKSRVRILHKENGGVSSARNAGAALAQGEYITFLDADDQMAAGWLQATLKEMRSDNRTGIAYTPLQLLTPSGPRPANWPPKEVDYAELARGQNQVPTCCLIRKEAFDRAGGYKKRFEPTEDGELWLRIAECGYTIECATPKPLFIYRLGHASLSRGKKLPDYVSWHLPSKLRLPPCPYPREVGSYGVRDYDRPVFAILINNGKGDVHDTLDSILAQSYQFWEAFLLTGSKVVDLRSYPFVRSAKRFNPDDTNAPLLVELECGDIMPPRYLETALRKWNDDGHLIEKVVPKTWYNRGGE
jgi:glycosyltransferase involved in cell wall biosynthesis